MVLLLPLPPLVEVTGVVPLDNVVVVPTPEPLPDAAFACTGTSEGLGVLDAPLLGVREGDGLRVEDLLCDAVRDADGALLDVRDTDAAWLDVCDGDGFLGAGGDLVGVTLLDLLRDGERVLDLDAPRSCRSVASASRPTSYSIARSRDGAAAGACSVSDSAADRGATTSGRSARSGVDSSVTQSSRERTVVPTGVMAPATCLP